MSRSLNKCMLIGNLGSDPEVRSTSGGQRVASFSLATARTWTTNGQKQEKTEWHRCVVWGKLSDVVEQYVKKGDRIYVEGSIEYRSWEDKEGQKRYSTEINVRELVMLGSNGERKPTPAKAAAPDDDEFAEFVPASLAPDDDGEMPF